MHRPHDVEVLGNILCDLYAKVKGEIMYFVANASPPVPLDIATSNFAGAYVTYSRGYWEIFCVTLTPRSKTEIKAGICDGVPSTAF